MTPAYPATDTGRDRWILERRPPRNLLDPLRPYAAFVEEEASESGEVVPVATVFLTNRECPWRCLMCDLWQNTLTVSVPRGAIPEQIRAALGSLRSPRQIKLYNAGSFFDSNAIPREDYDAIAALLSPFERVVVESHPALVGAAALRLRDLLGGRLEVAMGLETVHPQVLPRLNKRMTLKQFRNAADFLARADIAIRVFVLVGLPFVSAEEQLSWACRSVEYAFHCGASAVAVIPTRPGNGAMEALAERGDFVMPTLATLESAVAYGIRLGRGRVFADLWNLELFGRCDSCFPARAGRLREMNLRQSVAGSIECVSCRGSA